MRGWTWGNGSLAVREFDTDGRIELIDSAGGASLQYDDCDRLQFITALSGRSIPSWDYGYDSLDRLTSAVKSGQSQSFTYDSNGNRETQSGVPSGTYAYGYDGGGQLLSNRLQGVSGGTSRSYQYDAAGNVTSDGVNSHVHNDAGRMVTGNYVQYRHNALGQRVTTRYYPGFEFSSTYDESGRLLEKCYVASNYQGTQSDGCWDWERQVHIWLGDIPIATVLYTTLYDWDGYVFLAYSEGFNVHTDHLNTPRRLTSWSDPSNAIVWRWDSDAFGKGFENGNANNVADRELYHYDLRFPGQQWDAETWRHYNYFRDYDPYTGRYIESDPIGLKGGVNTYSYVGANPSRFSDPFGLNRCDVEAARRYLQIKFPHLFHPGVLWTTQLMHGDGIYVREESKIGLSFHEAFFSHTSKTFQNLVNNIFHETLHANDSATGNAIQFWQDFFDRNNIGSHHRGIWDQADQFVKEHEKEILEAFERSRIDCECKRQ